MRKSSSLSLFLFRAVARLQKDGTYSLPSIKYGTQNISAENDNSIHDSMPPPPVAMAPSKLKIQNLQEQLQQKNEIIHALEAEKRSLLASIAQKAKLRALAKMNMGWRKHNANPNLLYRSEGITEDEKGDVKAEKVGFVTEYRFAMEIVGKMNVEAGQAEARVQMRAEQLDAYPGRPMGQTVRPEPWTSLK